MSSARVREWVDEREFRRATGTADDLWHAMRAETGTGCACQEWTVNGVPTPTLVYHYYDGNNGGTPTLGINRLGFTADGWPYVM